LNAHRATAINHRAVQLELYEWNGGAERPARVEIATAGGVTTRLVAHRSNEALIGRHRELLRHLLGDAIDHLTMTTDSSGRFVSVRVAGLEIAHIEGDLSPRIYFGLEGNVRRLDGSNQEAFGNSSHAFSTGAPTRARTLPMNSTACNRNTGLKAC